MLVDWKDASMAAYSAARSAVSLAAWKDAPWVGQRDASTAEYWAVSLAVEKDMKMVDLSVASMDTTWVVLTDASKVVAKVVYSADCWAVCWASSKAALLADCEGVSGMGKI